MNCISSRMTTRKVAATAVAIAAALLLVAIARTPATSVAERYPGTAENPGASSGASSGARLLAQTQMLAIQCDATGKAPMLAHEYDKWKAQWATYKPVFEALGNQDVLDSLAVVDACIVIHDQAHDQANK